MLATPLLSLLARHGLTLVEERQHVRIESVDEAMLGGTYVVSQRLRGRNDDLIGIGPAHPNRLGDELVERHCLLDLLTVHQFRTYPGWHDFEHSDFGVA